MHSGAVISTAASQQEGSGFALAGRLDPFCEELFSGSLQQSEDMQTTGYSVPVGVSVKGWLFLCQPCDGVVTCSVCSPYLTPKLASTVMD